MNNNDKWYYSWGVIIAALIFVWPLGIALIVMRTQNSKSGAFSATSDKKVYSTVGAVLIVIGVLALIGGGGAMAVFMIAGGGLLIYYSNQLAKKAARNKQYIDLVVNKGETNINKIAMIVNAGYDEVLKELKGLQSAGVLRSCAMNEAAHTITIVRQAPRPMQPMYNNMQMGMMGQGMQMGMGQPVPQMQPVSAVMKCPGCGAEYTGTKGSTLECEYCGKKFVF